MIREIGGYLTGETPLDFFFVLSIFIVFWILIGLLFYLSIKFEDAKISKWFWNKVIRFYDFLRVRRR